MTALLFSATCLHREMLEAARQSLFRCNLEHGIARELLSVVIGTIHHANNMSFVMDAHGATRSQQVSPPPMKYKACIREIRVCQCP